MSIVTLPFTRSWDIKLPIVVRYLEKEFIDNFFKDGSLMLSSFRKFRKHKSNQLCDHTEGNRSMRIKGEKSQHTSFFIEGRCFFVLSTSIIESKEMMTELNPKYEDGFRIYDSINFAYAIASKLPEFIGGFQGNCIYRDDLVVRRNKAKDFPFKPPKSEEDIKKHVENYEHYLEQQNALESYFLKSIKYAKQNEYRFIWKTSLTKNKDHILIKCPEAIKYCERLGYT